MKADQAASSQVRFPSRTGQVAQGANDTRRWGPVHSGGRPRTGPMQRIGKQKAQRPHTLDGEQARERAPPTPLFWKSKNSFNLSRKCAHFLNLA